MDIYQAIIEKRPEITADGYGMSGFEGPSYSQARADLTNYEEAFQRSQEWLMLHPGFNRKCSSYNLKHQVERYFREKREHVYVPNGVFILAALSLGHEIRKRVPDSPNVMFK